MDTTSSFKSSISFNSSSPCSLSSLYMAKLLLFLAWFYLAFMASRAMEVDGVGAGMETHELRALYEVVGALLSDPSWAQLHPHPCTDTPWPGVQCELLQTQADAFLHVTKLHLGPDVASPPCKPGAKLSGSLLALPHLKVLSLFSCFLDPSSPVSLPPALFSAASSLEQLVIISNPGLSNAIPATLGDVRSLRVLSLSQNSLHGEIPLPLGGLINLQQLDLSYNKLAGRIPVELGGLVSLTILDLSWNGLVGEVAPSLGRLHSLQKIDLSANKLSGTIPPELGKLERLVLLDLSHNRLTGPIPESLSGLNELQYLLIGNNPIGTRVPLFVGSLKKLAVVGFSSCGLLGPVPTYFGSLSNLTALSLDRNRLNGSVPTSLDGLPHLGQLNLSQNQLSGEIALSDEFVSRLGKRLDVRDNKGLCTNPNMDKGLTLNGQAPPCLGSNSSNRGGGEKPVMDSSALKGGGRPLWDESKSSMLGFDVLLLSVWCLAMGLMISL